MRRLLCKQVTDVKFTIFKSMNFELCTDSLEGVLAASEYGFKRIELCSALSIGGLTPSVGLIEQCVKQSSVEVHVMIRHKEGRFNYSSADINIMRADIEAAERAGAHGVVFGVLTDDNKIADSNKELLLLAKSLKMQVTFHRAFDFVSDYKMAIEKLIKFDFDRLLTSGLEPKVEQGMDVITDLQANYGDKIEIMAGSGVSADNALKIASSGVENLHFTAHKPKGDTLALSMGDVMVVDEEKIENIISQF